MDAHTMDPKKMTPAERAIARKMLIQWFTVNLANYEKAPKGSDECVRLHDCIRSMAGNFYVPADVRARVEQALERIGEPE